MGEPTRGTPRSKGRHRMTEPLEGTMTEPQTSESISTKLERIAKLAKQAPEMAFRSLAHYIDMEWLREAYRRTRKAPIENNLIKIRHDAEGEWCSSTHRGRWIS